jgi:pheromone shutdown protein TraB
MRQLIGVGTPRGLQGRLSAVVAALLALIQSLLPLVTNHGWFVSYVSRLSRRSITRPAVLHVGVRELVFTTGC